MILGRDKRWWYGVGGVTVAAGVATGGVVVTAASGAQPVALRRVPLTTGTGAGAGTEIGPSGYHGTARAAMATAPGGAARPRGATGTTGKTRRAGRAGAAGKPGTAGKSGAGKSEAAGSTGATTGPCPDVNVVFARGT